MGEMGVSVAVEPNVGVCVCVCVCVRMCVYCSLWLFSLSNNLAVSLE